MSAEVTTVVPAHISTYLREALDSLLAQTCPHQILVVDDGSPGGEVTSIAREYGLPSLRNATSQGPATARNQGVEAARTRWVITFDCDNVAGPRYVERLHRAASRGFHVGVAYSRPVKFGGDSGPYTAVRRGLPWHLTIENFIDASSLLAKDAWAQVGGFDPASEPLSDWEMWLAIAARGWRLAFVPEQLWMYRVRADSVSGATPKEAFDRAATYVLEKHMDYVRTPHRHMLRNLPGRIWTRLLREVDGRVRGMVDA